MTRNPGIIGALTLLAASLLLGLAGCGRPAPKSDAPGAGANAESFIVLKGTTGAVQPQELPGTGGVKRLTYKTEAYYPTLPEIGQIREQLEAHGWAPLAEDPMTTSSDKLYLMTWQNLEDHSVNPPNRVHQWLGAWQDKHHDLMEYNLSYRYPKNGDPNMSDLKVVATYYPAAVVAEKTKGQSLVPAPATKSTGPETKY